MLFGFYCARMSMFVGKQNRQNARQRAPCAGRGGRTLNNQQLVHALLVLAIAVTWLAVMAVGWLGWQLLRQNGRILLRLDDLEKRLDKSSMAKARSRPACRSAAKRRLSRLPDLAGKRRRWRVSGTARPLVFFNPACGYCCDLAPQLKEKAESRNGSRPLFRTSWS